MILDALDRLADRITRLAETGALYALRGDGVLQARADLTEWDSYGELVRAGWARVSAGEWGARCTLTDEGRVELARREGW